MYNHNTVDSPDLLFGVVYNSGTYETVRCGPWVYGRPRRISDLFRLHLKITEAKELVPWMDLKGFKKEKMLCIKRPLLFWLKCAYKSRPRQNSLYHKVPSDQLRWRWFISSVVSHSIDSTAYQVDNLIESFFVGDGKIIRCKKSLGRNLWLTVSRQENIAQFSIAQRIIEYLIVTWGPWQVSLYQRPTKLSIILGSTNRISRWATKAFMMIIGGPKIDSQAQRLLKGHLHLSTMSSTIHNLTTKSGFLFSHAISVGTCQKAGLGKLNQKSTTREPISQPGGQRV